MTTPTINHITPFPAMPNAGQDVGFAWNIRAPFIGRVLVVRTGDGTAHSIIDELHPTLPTTVEGAFSDNPGVGSWLYTLSYTASLDPDVPEEFFEVVDSVTVTWPTDDTSDSNWAFLRQRNPPATDDGNWSGLRFQIPPTIDGPWSSIPSITPATTPSIDGPWSFVRFIAPPGGPTVDSLWSLLHGRGPPVDPLNRPPFVHEQQDTEIPLAVIDGSGRDTGAGAAYSGEDPDPGDTIIRWDAEMRRFYLGWSIQAETGGGFNSFASFGIYQDYFDAGRSAYGSLTDPQYMEDFREFRVRCQDNHGAWSQYETMLVRDIQAVHGSNVNVDSFMQRPDRRQPNIWAFKHGSTGGAGAGGVAYQYATPAEARADRANWVGSILYTAWRLYRLMDGTQPPVIVHSFRNVHPSLNATLADGIVTFTLKPDAVPTEIGEYDSSHNWVLLCQVLIDGGGGGNPNFWNSVTGFLFIAGDDTEDSDWSFPVSVEPTRDSNWSFLRSITPPSTLDSEWAPLAELVFEATRDSAWASLVPTGPTTDSDWSAVTPVGVVPTTDSPWSIVTRLDAPQTTDSEWSLVERLSAVLGQTIHSLWSTPLPLEPVGDREIFIEANEYFPCHDEGIRIRWGVSEGETNDRFAVLENGVVIESLNTHDGTWSGTRFIPSRYLPGGNTVTYTIRITRQDTIRVVNQATVARLEAELAAIQIRVSTALSTLTSRLSARSAARTAYNAALAAESTAQGTYDFAVSIEAGAQSVFDAADSTFNSTGNALIACRIINGGPPACASEAAAFASATTARTNALNTLNAAKSGTASALSALNTAKAATASALTTQNSAESAYDAQLIITNGLIDERAEIEFDLAGARLGVLQVVTNTIASESIEVEWVFCDPTTDSEWSTINVDLETIDSEWSLVVSGLETRDSNWSQLVGLLTRNSEWADLIGLVTEDSPWSDIIGPVVCDGDWSPFALFITEDSEWGDLVGLITEDSAWSDVIGPIVCDGAWSPFAVLQTENGEWSDLFGLLTQDSAWSTIVGPVVCDGFWSPFAVFAGMTRDSEWSELATPTRDSEWSELVPTPTRDSEWSPLAISETRDSEWSEIIPTLQNSMWSVPSNACFLPRTLPPVALRYNLWSVLSNYAYKPRAIALPGLVYRSEWSPVSNIARQEREVLSAIGGAIPFLHIYEARRGFVEVRSLVSFPTGDLFSGNGFEAGSVDANRENDRVLINPRITLGDMLSGDASLEIYRTTDSDVPAGTSPFRFYIAHLEGTDPNFRRIYYDVTPGSLLMSTLAHRIDVAATSAGISYQQKTALGANDGAAITFSFGGSSIPGSTEFVVIAVAPQHDNARLSRVIYRNHRVNDWYYYHGVPEIYVSDPVEIVADEDAFSYNGRDSANFQSPPHVGYASALVRQPQGTESAWFEQLLNRNHVITGQRVHILLRDIDGNYGKDFTGILQSPPLLHQDRIYDFRVTLQDPTTLMVQSFANSATLLGPQDALSSRRVGALIQRVAQAYADRVSGLELDDVLDPKFNPDNFPVPLAWFWTDYESERDILQRLVNTQGPPTGFYVNSLGQMVFTGCEDRGDPIYIGGENGIPISQVVTFSDHVVDVANDARIPVSLHGWVLPDIATTPEQVYENPEGLPEAVQVQIFETYSDNAIFDLARGGGIVFNSNGEYRYRIRTSSPALPTEDGWRITGDGDNVTVNQIAANLLEVVVMGTAGDDVPSFQIFGAELKHFRTIENWTSPTTREENQTRFSRYLYHQREFTYGGYNSIALRDAQLLADWAVQYYRKGIKTITLQLFCSNDVQEALRLEPDRTPVRISHIYGDGAPEQWIVRSRKRIYRDGHFWIDVVLDEDVMHSLGLEHSPLCAAYVAPDPTNAATYGVDGTGTLTFTGGAGDALVIPQYGLLSAAPDLAATVLPIARTSDTPQTVLTRANGTNLFRLVAGTYKAGHFDLTRLEALNDSTFYADGLRANGLSLWLVEPKAPSASYWAVLNLNLRSDGADGNLPAIFHFMRVRYAALESHSDVVLAFVTPQTTIHDGFNHWLTVAQEQPWLDASDAGAALRLHQHVIILDWQAFPMDMPTGATGRLEGTAYINVAAIAADAAPSSNVGGANGAQIVRRFGQA